MGHPPSEDWKHKPGTTAKRPEPDEKTAGQDEPVRFKFNDREYTLLDLSDLTFEEQEFLEDAFDRPVEEVDFRRAKALRWWFWISMRRAGADVKFEDLADLQGSAFEDVEDPTEPGGAEESAE